MLNRVAIERDFWALIEVSRDVLAAAEPPRAGVRGAPWDPPARCLLLLGHETRGVPDLPQAVPARVAHEPQVESLNVAMAGSILLADWYRKRRA